MDKLLESIKVMKESDKPAAQSIEDCQKWVDYDMKHYGKVSKNTQDIIDKAGFQIIKDDHGDYEVVAKKYEAEEGNNVSKLVSRVVGKCNRFIEFIKGAENYSRWFSKSENIVSDIFKLLHESNYEGDEEFSKGYDLASDIVDYVEGMSFPDFRGPKDIESRKKDVISKIEKVISCLNDGTYTDKIR